MKIGNYVIMVGGSGVINNIIIGDNCVVLVKIMVIKNLFENFMVLGYIVCLYKR